MSSTPGGPPPSKAGERQPSNTATNGSSEIVKNSQTKPGSTRSPTSAAIDAMLSTAKNASSTTPSTARTTHPFEPITGIAPPTRMTEHTRELSNEHEGSMLNADLSMMLRTLLEKVNDLTRAKAGADNHCPESTQGQEEEIANLRNTRRIPAELAAQIQRDLFGDSETPTQRQATPTPDQGQNNLEDADRDKAIKELQATIKDMNSRVHQATSAALEIDRVLKETQNSPFTDRIYNKPIQHVGKIRFPTYDGNSDPRQYMITFTIAMGRTNFAPDEKDAGYCQLFVEISADKPSAGSQGSNLVRSTATNSYLRLSSNTIRYTLKTERQRRTSILCHRNELNPSGVSSEDSKRSYPASKCRTR